MEQKHWKKTDEKLLEEWADHGRIYRWMHDRARMKYWRKNISFQIPVIILSTITGAANFAQDRVALEWRGYYALIVGFANIIAGVIATIATFLKVAELLEGHRMAGIAWAKYYHNVKTELQKEPVDRENVVDFMKYAKLEYEKLVEQSPSIPYEIILRLQNKIKGSQFDMHLPPIVGAFDKFNIGEQQLVEKVPTNMERVLNVLGDESLDKLEKQLKPRSSSVISRAVSFAPAISDFRKSVNDSFDDIDDKGAEMGATIRKILEEPESVNVNIDIEKDD